jgi:hypothetical protein
MSSASASSSTSDAPRSVSVRGLTGAAGPLHLAAEAHSPVEPIPSRARHSLPADRPAGRSDSPELSGPFDDVTRPSPVGGGTSPHLGSARRFSQPLSGFLAVPSSAALFRAAAVPGIPSLQSVPLARDRAPLSRPPAPLRSSTGVRRRTARSRSPPVSPTPASRDAVAWFPRRLWAPFPRAAQARFPVAPGPVRRDRRVPPASPASKPCSPCESVRTGPGCPGPEADALLGFCLSRASSAPASDPRPARTLRARARALTRRRGPAAPGDLAAPRAG